MIDFVYILSPPSILLDLPSPLNFMFFLFLKQDKSKKKIKTDKKKISNRKQNKKYAQKIHGMCFALTPGPWLVLEYGLQTQ